LIDEFYFGEDSIARLDGLGPFRGLKQQQQQQRCAALGCSSFLDMLRVIFVVLQLLCIVLLDALLVGIMNALHPQVDCLKGTCQR